MITEIKTNIIMKKLTLLVLTAIFMTTISCAKIKRHDYKYTFLISPHGYSNLYYTVIYQTPDKRVTEVIKYTNPGGTIVEFKAEDDFEYFIDIPKHLMNCDRAIVSFEKDGEVIEYIDQHR